MNNITGRQWGDLTEHERDSFLHCAKAVSGVDGGRVHHGECIVDFEGYNFSICGFLVSNDNEDEIIIDDDAVFYNPADING